MSACTKGIASTYLVIHVTNLVHSQVTINKKALKEKYLNDIENTSGDWQLASSQDCPLNFA